MRLENSPLEAKVDEGDRPLVDRYNWFLATNGYIVANVGNHQIYLHRTIMGEPDCLVDHEDRDKLNNQRSNLRLATHTLNLANSGPRKGKKFKGVHPTRYGTFSADICVNWKQIHIGTFKTENEAARAYNKMAKLAWGEFAYLNSVDE